MTELQSGPRTPGQSTPPESARTSADTRLPHGREEVPKLALSVDPRTSNQSAATTDSGPRLAPAATLRKAHMAPRRRVRGAGNRPDRSAAPGASVVDGARRSRAAADRRRPVGPPGRVTLLPPPLGGGGVVGVVESGEASFRHDRRPAAYPSHSTLRVSRAKPAGEAQPLSPHARACLGDRGTRVFCTAARANAPRKLIALPR